MVYQCKCKRPLKGKGGLSFRPIRGAGSPMALLGVAPTAEPPFEGREQLSTQAFYNIGGRMKTGKTPLPPAVDRLSEKLQKLQIGKTKQLRKNVRINF
jgi:hypothetical protein